MTKLTNIIVPTDYFNKKREICSFANEICLALANSNLYTYPIDIKYCDFLLAEKFNLSHEIYDVLHANIRLFGKANGNSPANKIPGLLPAATKKELELICLGILYRQELNLLPRSVRAANKKNLMNVLLRDYIKDSKRLSEAKTYDDIFFCDCEIEQKLLNDFFN